MSVTKSILENTIRCLACGQEYQYTSQGLCPECGYPTLSPASHLAQIQSAVNSFREKYNIKYRKLFLKTGDQFELGTYKGEGIQWKVLDVNADKALLLSNLSLEYKPFHDKNEKITWEKCSLRKWLNTEFYNQAFSEEDQERILLSAVDNQYSSSWGNAGGSDTSDHVFILGTSEVERYLNIDADRICYPTNKLRQENRLRPGAACYWRLRTPGYGGAKTIVVSDKGAINVGGASVDRKNIGIRPAMWINL